MSLKAAFEDDLFASKNRKETRNAIIGVISMILIACVLALLLILHMDANTKHRAHLESLITANYSIDGIGWTKQIGFTGHSFAISTDGVVHRCGMLTEERILSQKPISCADGATINPKK